jgi:DNA-directed RNA polymerase subunit RPC12/RpoP
MKKWYCLNCKKFVNTYIDIFKGFTLSCNECGSSRLMKLEDIEGEKFKKLVKNFKKKTGDVE